MAKATLTDEAREALIIQLVSEAYADAMETAEDDHIDPEWVDYQLQRMFHDYASEYRTTFGQHWQELASWEKANDKVTAEVRKITMAVAARYEV